MKQWIKKNSRQVTQTIIQFFSVFLVGMAVYKVFPTSLDQLYQPLVHALISALAIWGGSKIGPKPAIPAE
jgi:hypothetical protein